MYLCPSDSQYHLEPLCIVTWKHGFPCWHCVVSQSHHNCSHTLDTCAYASVHVYMSTWLPMSALPHLHSFMQTWVALCVCSSQPTSRPTPSLACVYGSVHVLISTWLPMSVQSLSIVTWKHGFPLCGTVCLSQPSYFCSNTLVRMCICISTIIYVHLTTLCQLHPVV